MSGTLVKVKNFEYSQGLHILRHSLGNIQSPYIASFLAIIFKEENDKEAIEKIRSWLFEYISPFVCYVPRDQTDLREKTLAIAVYIYLEDSSKNDNRLPDEYIIKYIEYAAKQEWIDGTLIAFLSSLSSDKFVVCASAVRFLQEKLPDFILQNNIEAICQSFYVLTNIEEDQKAASLNVIKVCVSSSTVSTFDLAWAILLLSKYGQVEDYELLVHTKENLFQFISRITDPFIAHSFSSKLNLENPQIFQGNKTSQNAENSEEDSQDNLIYSTMEWSDLCLVIACLRLSNCYYSTSIIGYPEKKIEKVLEELRKDENGGIRISKNANLVGNLLAILSTLVVGILGCIYLFSIQFDNSTIKITSQPDLGDLLLVVTWGDYFLSQIQALFRRESALEGMLEIPFIRHLDLFHRKKDK